LRNFGEASSGYVLRDIAQIATEEEKVFRFGKRALSYVQKMGIVTWGGSFGTFRNVRRNRGSGAAELGCQPVTLGDGKGGCAAVKGKYQLVTAPPDFKLAIVLHVPRLIIFMSMNLCACAVQWPAFGCRL